MNPLTNRWAALFAVAAILFVVSELADQDGVLSQYADSEPAPAVAQAKAEPAAQAVPTVVEDEPQLVRDEDVDEEDALENEASDAAETGGDESDSFDSEPEEMGTSIVSSEAPGPPGVFGSE